MADEISQHFLLVLRTLEKNSLNFPADYLPATVLALIFHSCKFECLNMQKMYSACDSKEVGLVLNPNGFRLKVKSWFKSLEELSSVTFSEFLRWGLVIIIIWFFQTSFFVDFAKSFQPLWHLAFISKKMNCCYSTLILSSHHILIFVAFIITLLYLHLNFNFFDRVLLLYSNSFKLISSSLKVIWICQCIIVPIMHLCQLVKFFSYTIWKPWHM